jgi:D-xylose transport system ATP-binding protein
MAVPATEKGPGPAAQGQPVLSLRGVNKSFGAVHVLHGVDLDCYAGQVTALVGDNGAGKSTLIKGVAGIHPFDDGDMLWEGEKVHVTGPRQANALGIEIVYQDLACATTSTSSTTCSWAASSRATSGSKRPRWRSAQARRCAACR